MGSYKGIKHGATKKKREEFVPTLRAFTIDLYWVFTGKIGRRTRDRRKPPSMVACRRKGTDACEKGLKLHPDSDTL